MSSYQLNGEQFNIHAQHEIDGITYPEGSLLLRREEWERLGISEIPDLAPEVQEPTSEQINSTILWQLSEIDRKSIRALREGDQERISALEAQAVELRGKLVK